MKFKATHTPGGMIVEMGPKEDQIPTPAGPLSVFKVKKILVPVDFSPCSLKALQYAAPFAKQFGAELVIVHVVESYIPVPEVGTVDVTIIQEEIKDGAKKELEKLRQSVDPELVPTAELRIGTPWVEVIETAKKLNVDLIIVSTHGRTGLSHVFMGSIAESIVRHAGCPVLVVREKEHEFIVSEPPKNGE
jgi:universal stress protein A